jgi:hypothetical protein
LIELDYRLWQEALHKILSISFFPSHNYIEFDGEYVEDANIIIKSDSIN